MLIKVTCGVANMEPASLWNVFVDIMDSSLIHSLIIINKETILSL